MQRTHTVQLSSAVAVFASLLLTGQALAATSPGSGARRHETSTTRSTSAAATAKATPAVRVPGSLTGLGFDVCTAPDQATMDVLRTQSPYWGVGVYIGGESRGCTQPELTRGWVHTQHAKGWRIVPIWNGLQAPTLKAGTPDEKACSSRPDRPMSTSNATARAQGVRAANRAVDAAGSLGMARGSTLFLDMEAYDNADSACNQPVMNFQSGWSKRVHDRGWRSGFYSSAGSGIVALDYVRATFPGTYTMPDAVWFAWSTGQANLNGKPYLRDSFWTHQRMHQYALDVTRTFGTATFPRIDENAIEIGRGSVPGKARHTCGVDLDFAHYWSYRRGARSTQVKAAQCLLKQHGLYAPRLSGRFDKATARGVGLYQDRRGLRVTRTLNGPTWTALLSAGATPLVKRGSAGDRVRFLQRSLTAALGQTVAINGLFTASTTTAVKRYQRAVGVPVNGVVAGSTWTALQRGRR